MTMKLMEVRLKEELASEAVDKKKAISLSINTNSPSQ